MKSVDITGERYGRLTAIGPGSKSRYWVFRCECGVEKEMQKCHVRKGRIKSCGCLREDEGSEYGKRHGLYKHPLYNTWIMMRQRCYNPKYNQYDDYGGRGIEVCARWNDSFAYFAEDMGDRPESFTLDRIDHDGNYEPGNCRWASRRDQQLNRRNNVRLSFGGVTMTMKEWSEHLSISYGTLKKRVASGWSDAEVITGKRSAS